MAGRKPDMRLKFLNKVTGETGQVGAAWENQDGSVSIVLNSKVVLTQNKDEVLTLFKANYSPTPQEQPDF